MKFSLKVTGPCELSEGWFKCSFAQSCLSLAVSRFTVAVFSGATSTVQLCAGCWPRSKLDLELKKWVSPVTSRMYLTPRMTYPFHLSSGRFY